MTNIERNIMRNEERIEKRNNDTKGYLKVLRAQKTRLLNKNVESEEEFNDVQEKLNRIEMEIMILENENHIPQV